MRGAAGGAAQSRLALRARAARSPAVPGRSWLPLRARAGDRGSRGSRCARSRGDRDAIARRCGSRGRIGKRSRERERIHRALLSGETLAQWLLARARCQWLPVGLWRVRTTCPSIGREVAPIGRVFWSLAEQLEKRRGRPHGTGGRHRWPAAESQWSRWPGQWLAQWNPPVCAVSRWPVVGASAPSMWPDRQNPSPRAARVRYLRAAASDTAPEGLASSWERGSRLFQARQTARCPAIFDAGIHLPHRHERPSFSTGLRGLPGRPISLGQSMVGPPSPGNTSGRPSDRTS